MGKWLAPFVIALTGCSLIGGSSATEPLADDDVLPLEALVPNRSTGSARAEFHRYQLLLQECMAAEGFEYHPVEMDAEVDPGTRPSPELVTYAADHGYGLTERLLPAATALDAIQAGVLPYYVEFDLSAFDIIETDPNVLYALSLSPEEAAAYTVALDGPDPEQQTAPPDYGCSGRISDQMDAEQQIAEQPDWLDEATRRIDEKVQSAAAEFAVADSRWSECMAGHGFSEFAERIEAPEAIRLGILEIVLRSTELTDVLDAASVGVLHELEMTVAAADADCYTTAYLPMSRGIEARLQTEVLTDLGVIPRE